MNELKIDYNKKGFQKCFGFFISGYLALMGIYFLISEMSSSNYSILFYCSFILIVISIILLISTVWKNRPMIIVTNESFWASHLGQKEQTISWVDVKNVSVGISSLSFTTSNSSKQISIELDSLRYKDLKELKSKVIELCENKSIPFHNN